MTPPEAPPAGKRSAMRAVLKHLFVLERRYRAVIKSYAWLNAVSNRLMFSFHMQPLARGLAIGMFWMAMPMPFQMVPATVCCILLFANLPAALLAVWISNPFTYVPIFYLEYQIGDFLFGSEQGAVSFAEFSENYHQVAEMAGEVFVTILQGALVFGAVMAVVGYVAAFPLARYMLRFSKWRLHRE